MLHPQNPLNREIQISRYLAVQIQLWDFGLGFGLGTVEFEFLVIVDFGGVAFSVQIVILR